ncbi:MAG: glycosyltransferase, partial [Bacteroidota bacterium]
MQRKKVLIITYYWPPASSPGVYRFLKFARYLREFGWEPIILTVKKGSYPSYDYTLLNEIPEDLTVYQTSTIEPFAIYNKLTGKKGKSVPVGIHYDPKEKGTLKKMIFYIRANYFIPDARKGWAYFAKRKAKKIIQKERVDAIITTGPPHSTHLTGLYLKKHFDIPWIADFRDPWTNIYYNHLFPRTKKTKKKDYLLETKILTKADCITVVSKGMYNEFSSRAKRIEILPNGFDKKDMPQKKDIKTREFIMSYIGNFKHNQNIENLWKALDELKNENEQFQKFFKLQITGNVHDDTIESIKKYKLTGIVHFENHVPHHIAVQKMVKSNLLLFIIPQAINNHAIITGKLFEYIASRTPILSIGPPE